MKASNFLSKSGGNVMLMTVKLLFTSNFLLINQLIVNIGLIFLRIGLALT